MSEVEKLYKLVGCEKYVCTHKVQKYCDRNGKCSDTSEFTLCLEENCKKGYKNIVFDEYNDCYFSPKEQLELIKLLSKLKDYEFESVYSNGLYFVGCREALSNNKYWASNKNFEMSLAELVCELWSKLTDTEKSDIKGILENE